MKKIQLVLMLLTLSIGTFTYAEAKYKYLGIIDKHEYILMPDRKTVEVECLVRNGSFNIVVGEDRDIKNCKICNRTIPMSEALEKTVAQINKEDMRYLNRILIAVGILVVVILIALIVS